MDTFHKIDINQSIALKQKRMCSISANCSQASIYRISVASVLGSFWWFAGRRQEPSATTWFIVFTSVSWPIHIKHHLDVLTGSQTWHSSERGFINIPHLSGQTGNVCASKTQSCVCMTEALRKDFSCYFGVFVVFQDKKARDVLHLPLPCWCC